MDIKNTLEVLEVLDATSRAITKSREDGEINYWDAPNFVKIVPPAIKALQDIKKVELEIKDLDSEEVKILMDRLFNTLTLLMNAILKKSP